MTTEIANCADKALVVDAGLTPAMSAWLEQQEFEINRLIAEASERWVRIGLILIEVRKRLEEGQFRAWITLKSGLSRATVYRRIEAAQVFGDLYDVSHETSFSKSLSHRETPINNITPTAMNLLLDSPEEIQKQAKEAAVAGGKITPAIVRQMVKLHKDRNISVEPSIGGRSNLIPKRIEEATLPLSTVSRFRIDGEVRQDPEGDKMVILTEEVIEDEAIIRTTDTARTVPEAFENVAGQIDEYDPNRKPKIAPEPHEGWAAAIGAAIAKSHGLEGEEIEDVKSFAVALMLQKAYKFDESTARRSFEARGDAEAVYDNDGAFRGWVHPTIKSECHREAERLRNGGLYSTKRGTDKIVARQIPEESDHRSLVVMPKEVED